MVLFEIRVEKQNLECTVILKKREQKVCFIPRAAGSKPFFWILKRPENIVKVNDHSRRELWKNTVDKISDIRSCFGHVRGINEQNIILLKSSKIRYRSILYGMLKYADSRTILIF